MSFFLRRFIYGIGAVAAVAIAALVLLLLGSLYSGQYGYDIRIVESGSMEPAIPTGAVVLTRPQASYAVGDVVTYQRRTDTSATTHRLVEATMVAGEPAFIAQGDANNVADVEPVRPAEIAGRVWYHIPYLGYILSFFRSPLGFLILVIVPAVLIVWEQVARIRRTLTAAREQNT